VVGACGSGRERSSAGADTNIVDSAALRDRDQLNLIISASELPATERRALRGDNEAANALGNHYFYEGQLAAEFRWRALAAERGHCLSITLLKDHPSRLDDREWRRRWNDLQRRHGCTWGKTYPDDPSGGDPSRPLWEL
jgi:hypothetical protein